MPQPRIYEDNAERQAAYRRRKGRQMPTQNELAELAWGLHFVIKEAVEYSAFPLPSELSAASPEITLRNLMKFFDVIYDPVRNPNGKIHRKPRYSETDRPKTDKSTP